MSARERTILVTGASSGLGKGCAERMLREGVRVIAVGRNQAHLRGISGISPGDDLVVDLAQPGAPKQVVDSVRDKGVILAGCVLAAGIHSLRPMMMESFVEIGKPLIANAQATLALVAALVKARLFAKESSIVLFSSAAARTGTPAAVAYAASKGAIEAATYSLAAELAPLQIRVNAIAPGLVRTPMSEGFLSKFTSDQIARLDARHLLGPGSPEDISGPVAFLLSPDARWITGTVLPVDGGYSVS